jgi:hypothetical protein
MAETIDATLVKINATMEALLAKLGGTVPGQSIVPSDKESGTPASNQATLDLFGKAGKVLGEIAADGAGVTAVFHAIAGSKDPIIEAFKTIANISKIPGGSKAIQLLEYTQKPNQAALATGKDTDVYKQGQQERGTNVSYADFQKMMSQNQPGLTGAGSVQNDRTDNLYKTLQQLIDKNQDKIAAGATTPEALAKALITSQQQSKNDLGTDAGRGRAVEAAQRFAESIDAVAKRTGESRDVIAENNAKQRASGSEQALLSQMGTQQQRDSYIKSQADMAGMGESYQKLAKEYAMFGAAVSPEAQAKQMAIGQKAAMELRDGMISLKNATTENARAQAEAKLETAKGSANEAQRDPRTAKMAMMADVFTDEPILQQFKKGYEENKEAAGYQYNRNQGATPAQASGNIRDQVGNLQAGRQQTGAAPTEGMRLQQAIIEGNTEAARKAGEVYRAFNTELSKNTGIVDSIVNGIRAGEAVGKTPAGEKKEGGPVTETPRELPAPQNRPPAVVNPQDRRDLGTLGKTGSSFEPKDVIALLHKGERVLSPSENADLTNLFGMVSDLKPKSNLGGALSNIKPQTEDTAVASEEETSESTSNAVADSSGITLKDLNDSLQQLNSNIELMVSHTADMKDSSRETADMSGKLTGNRFAV